MKTHKEKPSQSLRASRARFGSELLANMSATPVIGQNCLWRLTVSARQFRPDNGHRTRIRFVDDGYEDGLPVVFTGGLGTSVRVIRLLDFLETMRRDLAQFITVGAAVWPD